MALVDPLNLEGNYYSTIFGTNLQESYYQSFLDSFLYTGNSLPIGNLWLVVIQDMPSSKIIKTYNERENGSLGTDWYEKASSVGKRAKGIIIAQGVKHVGDGVKYSREGFKNTGLITGVLSNGRSDFQELSISFLENNVSFVDYAIRPWLVALAHEGLTNKSVVANSITVFHLSKMGARNKLANRKVIKYHNCFPISVDQQEYNMGGGGDVNVKRQVTFGYHYYTLENGDSSVLDLLSFTTQERKILNTLKDFTDVQREAVLNQIEKQAGEGFFARFINNIITKAKNFGKSLLSGTIDGIITNATGMVQDAVGNAVRGVAGELIELQQKGINAVADATRGAIDSITNFDENEDVPKYRVNNSDTVPSSLSEAGYSQKNTKTSDSVTFQRQTFDAQESGILPEINVNKEINLFDTPNNVTNDVSQNDLSEGGGISINRQFASGDVNNDTPTFYPDARKPLFYIEKNIKDDDTPKYVSLNSSISQQKEINKNDTPNFTSLNDSNSQQKTINKDDSTSSSSILYFEKTSKRDDSNPTSSVQYEDIALSDNDSTPSNSIRYVTKSPREDDSNIGNNVSFKNNSNTNVKSSANNSSNSNISNVENSFKFEKDVNKNDSNIGENIPTYIEKEISKQDIEISKNLKYEEIITSPDDSNPSSSIKQNNLTISSNDSNPSESIKYNEKKTKGDDSNPSGSIKYVEKLINNNDSNIGNNVRYSDKSNNNVKSSVDNSSNLNINSVESAFKLEREINKNDSNIGDNIPSYIEKEVNQNDSKINESDKNK